MMNSASLPASDLPAYARQLEAIYGAPSQAAFGSAVFFERLETGGQLEKAVLAKYRYFVGKRWDQVGKSAWMSTFRPVYTRQPGTHGNILTELATLAGPNVASAADMILNNIDQAEQGRKALVSTYDAAEVAELSIYAIGDGEAMSGLIIVGYRTNGEVTQLVFLMD